ncbi:hypothetical protein [uncultured Campylobacter sp.]|uniref:hypothetical protein n=1 Tax=uncultured Campylobacter sp. TaxID=218934 RepID=UPI00261C6F17|nr:hypothetical protein [uncultured Campylobacter sp.]
MSSRWIFKILYFLLGASYGLLFSGMVRVALSIHLMSIYLLLFYLMPGFIAVVIVKLLISNQKLKREKS